MQLGFTFYPKDWWTSETFYSLEPAERYIYLECIFLMYANDGYIPDDKANIQRRLMMPIEDGIWLKVTDLFIKEDDKLTHKSVNKRLKKTISNRQNGQQGGRPKKEDKNPNNPNNKPIAETQTKPNDKPNDNPPYKKKENRIEYKLNNTEKNKEFFDLSETEINHTIEFEDRTTQKKFSVENILSLWQAFKLQYEKEFYISRTKAIQHFRNWLKTQNIPQSTPAATNGKRFNFSQHSLPGT